MILRNLLPHPLVHIPHGRMQQTVVRAEPTPARVAEHASPAGAIEIGGMAVHLVTVAPGAVSGLPEPTADVLLVVSRFVATNCPYRTDLVVPFDEVRDNRGRVIGCRALARLTTEQE